MDASTQQEMPARLRKYLQELERELRDKRQRASFALYALGLLSEGERKSMEPIAARACGDPTRTQAFHERFIHFLADSPWKDEPIRRRATRYAVDAMQEHGPIKSWIVDDTGFLKQGKLSPGVQRQYTGSAGKTANCQVGVSLVLATDHAHVASDFRLYIPESWAEDRERCRRAHIPDEIGYQPKWCLALQMIEHALRTGLPRGVILADCDYGNKFVFRDTLTAWDVQYAVEIQSTTKMRIVDSKGSLSARVSAAEIAARLKSKMRALTWREGTKVALRSRFARIRVRVDRDNMGAGEPEWLLVEWPKDESGPTKFVLSTMPVKTTLKQLVRMFKTRWRIERSYEDLKGELGLDHYEGRSFVGWNHHVSVVLACYAFLVAEQARSFSPSARGQSQNRTLENAA